MAARLCTPPTSSMEAPLLVLCETSKSHHVAATVFHTGHGILSCNVAISKEGCHGGARAGASISLSLQARL